MKTDPVLQAYQETSLGTQLSVHLDKRAYLRRTVPLLPVALAHLIRRLGAKCPERNVQPMAASPTTALRRATRNA